MTSKAQLVYNEDADAWGVYYPSENVIEAAIGNDVHPIPGEFLGVHWERAEGEDLRESIQSDIQSVREDIEELRGRELTEEQQKELDRMERKLESHETVLEIAREVGDSEDGP